MSGIVMNTMVKIIFQRNTPNIVQKRTFLEGFLKLFKFGKPKKKCNPPTITLTECSRIETRGMSMPMIGMGTWQIEPDCVDSVLSYGLEVGYRHIDTSHSYGNQAAIGDTIHKLINSGKYCRSELFISSKLPYYGMTPEMVCTYVQNALSNLRLNYLDLFIIHYPVGIKESGGIYSPDPDTNHVKIWKALEEEVEKCTIKNIGLCNFNECQIRTILECAKIPPANLQVEMHLYLQQRELRDFCTAQSIAMTAYAPLGSPGLDQYLMKNGLQANKVPVPLHDHCVQMIACKYRKTPAQVLLRFLLQLGVAVIPKSVLPERICKNYGLFDFCLDSCEMDELCGKDMGERGRMFSCNVWVGTENHPLYPFPKEC
ncbi:hypothetical protein O3M35_006535 [Rhynocoris fuscipes]|uniref:NADP-dependent oxidoreductase domain-containing protein n=1 Tax=Rhynocoris fuscipes TaxID=488301 RepID=A0AAW1DEM8_9HEMI